jgi:hypothetical protein
MKLPTSVARAVAVALTLIFLTVAPLGCSNCDLEIVTNTLPDGIVGVLYSFQVVSDCGGDFWFVGQGNLPPGIGLLDNGILRGTPSDPGTATFTLGVDNLDTGDQTFKGFSLTIDRAS